MKRARDDVVHVYNAVSGEEWATVSTEDFPTVRSLKQHLEGPCGVPRFRQRLLLGESTLQDDAKLGSSDLRLVLQAFAKTSKRQANELTALARSVKQGSIQRVEEILQRLQDPDLTDQNGRTPLYIASLQGNRSIVQLLLEARASAEKRYTIKIQRFGPSRARSALGAAVIEGHEDVARLLLQAMANPNKFGGNSYCGVYDVWYALGRSCGIALDDPDMPALRTPLWHAAMYGKEPIVRLLLRFSADANKISSDTFSTPLGVACLQNRLQIVRLLLEARADKDAVCGQFGETPLLLAVIGGHTTMVGLLLEARADCNPTKVCGHLGLTIHEAAAHCQNEEIACLLAAQRTDLALPPKRRCTKYRLVFLD